MSEFPRPLTDREEATLRYMLSVDDARLDPLREQVAFATATGRCRCGCATIDLEVDRTRARPAFGLPSPVTEAATGSQVEPPAGLILFLEDGWLSLLEIWWIDEPPPEFPQLEEFEPPRLATNA